MHDFGGLNLPLVELVKDAHLVHPRQRPQIRPRRRPIQMMRLLLRAADRTRNRRSVRLCLRPRRQQNPRRLHPMLNIEFHGQEWFRCRLNFFIFMFHVL